MNIRLVNWLVSQKAWLQEVARRILEKDSFDAIDVAEVAKMVAGTLPVPAQPTIVATHASAGTTLKLVSLGPVSGIDRLKPKSPLTLGGKPISIIYGANGTGKSGYVRILKNLSGKPRAPRLRSDVFAATPSEAKCTVSFLLNGSERAHEWAQSTGPVADFGSVDVYDTVAGSFYLDQDLEVNYAPPEITLLSKLVEACKAIDAELTSERDTVVTALPLLPPDYNGTEVATLYQDVLTNAAKFPNWSPESAKELLKLQARVAEADPAGKIKGLEETKTQATKALEELRTALGKVSQESIASLRAQIAKTKADVSASEDSAKAFGDLTKLEGVSTTSWKALWESARKYSETMAYKEIAFPNLDDGALCVLCNQPLGSEAIKRMSAFEGFVKGQLSAAAEASQLAQKVLTDALSGAPSAEDLKTAMVASSIEESLQVKIETLWKWIDGVMIKAKNLPSDPSSLDGYPSPPIDPGVVETELSGHIGQIAVEVRSLAAQLVPGERLGVTNRIKELRAIEWASQQADAIAAEVGRLTREVKYNRWISETGTTGISRKAGELADELITQAFVDRFNRELGKLGATRIRVEFKKTSATAGRPKYRLVLKGVASARPGEILSEGENRVVSLAAFLADVTGRDTNTPFIFDDPISSLDQSFEEKTASRLVELSATRQVIVFTHRLSLASLIQNSPGVDAELIALSSEHWGTGNPGTVPLFGNKPEKALNELNSGRLPQARRVLQEQGSAEYAPLGKALCSDFRILLERFVEQVLLNEVVLRFRRSVQTYNRLAALSRIKRSDCDFLDGLMTKYSIYEHSQPSETPVEPLQPDEISSDIELLRAWFREFGDRAVPA